MNLDSASEEQIQNALRSDDRDEYNAAWAWFCNRHSGRVRAYLSKRYSLNTDEIEKFIGDVFQDSLLRLIQTLRANDKKVEAVDSFLYGIARNKMKERFRQSNREPQLPDSQIIRSGNNPGPGSIAIVKEFRRACRHGLAQVQTETASRLLQPRGPLTNAPLLQIAVLDALAGGVSNPSAIRSVLQIEPHQFTRLRDKAIDRIDKVIKPSTPTSSFGIEKIDANCIEPGTCLADVWQEGMFGCFFLAPTFDREHDPSHEADLRAARDCHRELTKCEVCYRSTDLLAMEADAAVAHWAPTLQHLSQSLGLN